MIVSQGLGAFALPCFVVALMIHVQNTDTFSPNFYTPVGDGRSKPLSFSEMSATAVGQSSLSKMIGEIRHDPDSPGSFNGSRSPSFVPSISVVRSSTSRAAAAGSWSARDCSAAAGIWVSVGDGAGGDGNVGDGSGGEGDDDVDGGHGNEGDDGVGGGRGDEDDDGVAGGRGGGNVRGSGNGVDGGDDGGGNGVGGGVGGGSGVDGDDEITSGTTSAVVTGVAVA